MNLFHRRMYGHSDGADKIFMAQTGRTTRATLPLQSVDFSVNDKLRLIRHTDSFK